MQSDRPCQFSAMCRLFGICGYILFVIYPACSQDRAVGITPRTSFRSPDSLHSAIKVDVRMIVVPVAVTDSLDYPVTDLPRSSFKIYENNIEQSVVSLIKEDGPASVGFIFDTSRSMTDRMGPSIAAIQRFLQTMTPGDEYFLLRFNNTTNMVVDFTGNPERISAALPSLRAEDWTALNDAIYRGVQEMRRAKNPRKAIFVLTDGADNYSRYSDSEVRRLVQESDVRVYSIGLFTRPDFLATLGKSSGGRAFWVHNIAELPNVVEKLSAEFRNTYLLGYSPRSYTSDGKYHRIRVQLVGDSQHPPLHVSWRAGYYASSL